MESSDRDLVLQLLWTRGEEDLIDTPSRLKAWLLDLGLIDENTPVTESDVAMARHLRAATRSLCIAKPGEPPDPRTAAAFDAVNAAAPMKVTAAPHGGLDIEPGGTGVPRALSTMLGVGYRATITGEFARYKVCKGCGFAYFDETKNLSRSWCAMGLCGAKNKMRAYRARKRAEKA